MTAAALFNIVMLSLQVTSLLAIVHPRIQTGFWVTIGFAGVFMGAASALDPSFDQHKAMLLMASGHLIVAAGVVARSAKANKNCRSRGQRRRATDDLVNGGWSKPAGHGAGRSPVNES